MLANQRLRLASEMLFDLIKGSDSNSLTRYKIIQNNNLRDFKIKCDKLTNQAKKMVKTTLNQDKTVNLTPGQVATISSTINKGLLFLQNDAIDTLNKETYKKYGND